MDPSDASASPAPRPKPASPGGHSARVRPDANPMRLALGAAGLAALSAIAAAIVLPPRQAVYSPTKYAQEAAPAVQYVHLQLGQTAPPGATVIGSSAKPVALAAPAVPKPIIIRTTQSGKRLP